MNNHEIKYTLVLTALRETVPKNKKKLYLGEWCLPKENNCEIMSSIFFSAQKINEAYNYCESIYTNILTQLVDELNKIHKINLDYKAYEIILGNWLKIYIHQLYEKYSNIKLVYKKYKIDNVYILDETNYYIPLEYNDYKKNIISDIYNLQQYSLIVKFLNKECIEIKLNSMDRKKYIRWKDNKKLKYLYYLLNIPNIFIQPKATITSPYITKNFLLNYFKLFFSKIGFYRFDEFSKELEFKYNVSNKKRKQINLKFNNDFEKLLANVIPYNVPRLFIEYFSKVYNTSDFYIKNKTPIYYTTTALLSNNIYKFFLAKNHRNVKIISHQHGGGGYGTGKVHFSEQYERDISDYFFTWGWKKKNTYFVPHSKITINMKDKKNKESDIIFLPLTGLPRYSIRFQDQYFGSLYLNYQNNLFKFLELTKLRDNILVRNYPNYYGWNTDIQLEKKFQKIKFDNNKNFYSSLKNSKILISLHISTTYLESLILNIPTLLYVDLNMYEFSKEANELIISLNKVNIVFFNVEDLVIHLDNNYSNIEDWWKIDEVQKARKEFLNKFAKFGKEFHISFLKNFNDILEDSNE